jgi:hypothetical protein
MFREFVSYVVLFSICMFIGLWARMYPVAMVTGCLLFLFLVFRSRAWLFLKQHLARKAP